MMNPSLILTYIIGLPAFIVIGAVITNSTVGDTPAQSATYPPPDTLSVIAWDLHDPLVPIPLLLVGPHHPRDPTLPLLTSILTMSCEVVPRVSDLKSLREPPLILNPVLSPPSTLYSCRILRLTLPIPLDETYPHLLSSPHRLPLHLPQQTPLPLWTAIQIPTPLCFGTLTILGSPSFAE